MTDLPKRRDNATPDRRSALYADGRMRAERAIARGDAGFYERPVTAN